MTVGNSRTTYTADHIIRLINIYSSKILLTLDLETPTLLPNSLQKKKKTIYFPVGKTLTCNILF